MAFLALVEFPGLVESLVLAVLESLDFLDLVGSVVFLVRPEFLVLVEFLVFLVPVEFQVLVAPVSLDSQGLAEQAAFQAILEHPGLAGFLVSLGLPESLDSQVLVDALVLAVLVVVLASVVFLASVV